MCKNILCQFLDKVEPSEITVHNKKSSVKKVLSMIDELKNDKNLKERAEPISKEQFGLMISKAVKIATVKF